MKGEVCSADQDGATAAAPLFASELDAFTDNLRFNLDETGLYWCLLPLKPSHQQKIQLKVSSFQRSECVLL